MLILKWIKNFWYNNVSSQFPHRNKWVISDLPRTYLDKDTIIEKILYKCIIDYVDVEKCFDIIDWNASEISKKHALKIKEIYKWAKTDKDIMLSKLDVVHSKLNIIGDDFSWLSLPENEDLFKEINQLADTIANIDTTHLEWIIKNRQILWT